MKFNGFLTPKEQLITAIIRATAYHAEQVDKAGVPFILHILRVGLAAGPTLAGHTVGFLHDIVEDTPVTLEELREAGFSSEVLAAVDAMTRSGDETYWEYLDRLVQNPLARHVKRADLLDNLAADRQNFEGAEKLMTRYSRALEIVENAIAKAAATEGPTTAHQGV